MASPGIRVGVGLEGAKSFQDDLKKMTAKCKALDAQMKELASGFDKESKSQGKNAKEREALNKLIEAQKQKAALLADQIKALEDAGEGETEQCYKLKKQLAETNTTINNYSKETKEAASATGVSTGQIIKAGAALGAMKLAATAVVGAIKGIAKAAVNAAKGVWNLGVESGQWADELITNSTQMGVDVETLQEWGYAARFIDTEVSTMTGGMKKLTKAYAKGTSARKKSVKIAKGVTVSLKKENGEIKSQAEFYLDVIDSLHGMTNIAQRNAAAQKLFGKSYTDMIPLIESGTGALRQYSAEARNMGVIISADNVGALGRFDDQMQRFDATISAIKTNLAVALLPILEIVSGRIETFLGKVSKALSDGFQPEDVDTIIDSFLEMFKYDPNGTEETNSAMEFIGGLVGKLKTSVESHKEDIKGVVKSIMSFIWEAFKELTGLKTPKESAEEFLGLPENATEADLQDWGNDFYASMNEPLPPDSWEGKIANWFKGIFAPDSSTSMTTKEALDQLGAMGTDSYASGMESEQPKVEGAADSTAMSVQERIGPSRKRPIRIWGQEQVEAYAAGMRDGIPSVRAAGKEVADAAAAPIHYSLPDYGPLRHVGEWGGEMIDKYVDGIKRNVWRVTSAIGGAIPNVNPMGSTTNYGGVTIVVNGAAGQDVNALADIVMTKMQNAVNRREAVFA